MVIKPLALVTPPDAALWYDSGRPLALGCMLCPDLDMCGGLRIEGGVFDCRSLCACARNGKKCSGVCRGDQRTFVARVREIDGFTFSVSTRPLLASTDSPRSPGRDEIGYEAAVPDRAVSHRAPSAISFLYLISARG
jgi:hypothetical protein